MPAIPNGSHGHDVFPHAGRRARPRHGEPLGNVRLNLGAQPQHKTALGVGIQVVANIRQGHGRPGERHGD